MIIREFCADGFDRVPEAIAAGASRIELCAQLEVGGVTPSSEIIQTAVNFCHSKDVPVMVIIRCRGGDFCYSDAEFEEMKESIMLAKKLGADGVVFGALDVFGSLDDRISKLLSAAEGMLLTFHMAFDEIPADKQFETIDNLCTYGFHRILTHGGVSNTNIEENLDRLEKIVEYSKGRICIMPGGGVTTLNAEAISKRLGVNELHGTRIVSFDY